MIVTKLISGLGNQLFQYAVGRQLSIKHGVPLKLDVSFFASQDLRSYKLHHYNINADIATTNEITNFTKIQNGSNFLNQLSRKAVELVPKSKRRYYKENEWWVFEPDLLKVSSNVYIDGYWQHYKYFENINPSIFKELTLKGELIPSVQDILTQIESNTSSVSIHIRRGDYITDVEANRIMGTLPLSYYYKSMDYIKKKVPNPVFYFFSDDLEWVKANFKGQEDYLYVDSRQDYIDLKLMSSCRHNIIANSSFSWWGAFLNKNPHKIVITPSQWVVRDDMNSKIEIQFPEWIKL